VARDNREVAAISFGPCGLKKVKSWSRGRSRREKNLRGEKSECTWGEKHPAVGLSASGKTGNGKKNEALNPNLKGDERSKDARKGGERGKQKRTMGRKNHEGGFRQKGGLKKRKG